MGGLADYFRDSLNERGLNYSELARLTGISAVYVMKVVKGERIPSDSVIGKLSRALGLDPRKALFLAHKDKTPDEFRDLFRLPEPALPAVRRKLLALFKGDEGEALKLIETDHLSPFEKSVIGLFARMIAERAIVDEPYRQRHTITDDFLERLEWAEAYFSRLLEEMGSPSRQNSFCKALGEVVRWWDVSPEEDILRVKMADGREAEYKFCLLELGKFRKELVLESVKSRAVESSRDKSLGEVNKLSRGALPGRFSPGKGLSTEQYIINRLKDDATRDFFLKAMELSPEDLEETRDIVALKLRRSSRPTG